MAHPINELLKEERARFDGGITRAVPPGMTEIASPGGRVGRAVNAQRPANAAPVFTPPPAADREREVIDAEAAEANRNPFRFGGPSATGRNTLIPQMSFPRLTQEIAEGKREIGEAFTAGAPQQPDDFQMGKILRNTAGQAIEAGAQSALALGEDIGIDTFFKGLAGALDPRDLPIVGPPIRTAFDQFGRAIDIAFGDDPTGTEEVIEQGAAPVADAVSADEDVQDFPPEPGVTIAAPPQANGGANGSFDTTVDQDFRTPQDVIQTPIRERQAAEAAEFAGGENPDFGLNFPPGFDEADSRMMAAINNLPPNQRARALEVVGENRDFERGQFQDQTARITAESNAQRAAGGAAELIELNNGNQGMRIVMPDSSVLIVDTEQLLPIANNTFMTSEEVAYTDEFGNKFDLEKPLFFQGIRDPDDPRKVTMEKMAIDASNQVMSQIANDEETLRLFNEEVAKRISDGLSKQAATQEVVDLFEEALNE